MSDSVLQMMQWKSRALFLASVALLGACGALANQQAAMNPSGEDAAGFKEFSANVQRYVGLHNRLNKSLPKLKDHASPEAIASHQHALARKIQAARKNAREGDIFVPKATKAFQDAIALEFRGSQGKNARATMRQGAPLNDVHIRVNQVYPDALPYTSVPPTLLLKLPKLPGELAYRIADRDLLLLDLNANLVVDVLRGALP